MIKRAVLMMIISILMIFPCLLFLDLFEPGPQDGEIKLLISLMTGCFSYWLVKHLMTS